MPSKKLQTTVHLFTDGARSGNLGRVGWGCILRHLPTGKEKELSGSEPQTTNNRMELMAVIQGLRQLNRPCGVLVVSDSQYVLNGLEKWMKGWKSKGWRLSDGKPVKNQDLWMELDELKSRHSLTFQYVHGHAGHEENERCDQLAVDAWTKLKDEISI